MKADPTIAMLLIWVALVVLFFSISPGKRNVYILPALPMLALAASAVLTGVAPKVWFEKLVSGLLWFLGGVVLLAGVLALIHHPALVKALADYTDDLTGIGYLFILLGLLWFLLLWLARKQFALVKMGIVSALGWVLISTWGYSMLDEMRTPRSLMLHTAEVIGEDAELGLVNFKEQFILFSPMSVTHFSYLASVEEQERNAWQWMQENKQRYLLVPSGAELSCFDIKGGKSMGMAHRDEWILLSATELKPQCEKPKREYRYFTDHPGRWLKE